MIAKNRKPAAPSAPAFRCAVYTRKSTEDGLEQEFNSLDAQRDAGESYIKSQVAEGWQCLADRYDDGGFTGGNMDRPALRRLLADIEAGKIDCVVVYKVDRLSRSLLDFARMMETFDKHGVSFVSVTQQFNTASSMGRLVLNVLLSFAQFEREMISERTRDKIAAARRKGKWVGGMPLLGYNVVDSKLVVDPDEAEQVRQVFALYLQQDGLIPVVQELNRRNWRTKKWTTKKASSRGGQPFTKNRLWRLLTNVAYIGKLRYKDEIHDAEHQPIVPPDTWQRTQAKLARQGRTGGREVRNKFGAILPTVLDFPEVGGQPGRPRQHPQELYADAGYDSEATRCVLRWLGIEPHIRHCTGEHGSHLGRIRWVVERTISWLKGLRRMRVRYDRSETTIDAWTSIAAAVVCLHILTDTTT